MSGLVSILRHRISLIGHVKFSYTQSFDENWRNSMYLNDNPRTLRPGAY